VSGSLLVLANYNYDYQFDLGDQHWISSHFHTTTSSLVLVINGPVQGPWISNKRCQEFREQKCRRVIELQRVGSCESRIVWFGLGQVCRAGWVVYYYFCLLRRVWRVRFLTMRVWLSASVLKYGYFAPTWCLFFGKPAIEAFVCGWCLDFALHRL
jgi:hypothetical protein